MTLGVLGLGDGLHEESGDECDDETIVGGARRISSFILRRNTRMALVQLAAQRVLVGRSSPTDCSLHKDAWGWGAFDHQVLEKLHAALVEHWNFCVDQAVNNIRWDWERTCPVLRAIVVCAILELKYMETDIKVVVTEYGRITDAFYPDMQEKVAFVRGVINTIERHEVCNSDRVSRQESV
jgi:transcription termination factor NusB